MVRVFSDPITPAAQLVPVVGWYRSQMARHLGVGLPGLGCLELVAERPRVSGRPRLAHSDHGQRYEPGGPASDPSRRALAADVLVHVSAVLGREALEMERRAALASYSAQRRRERARSGRRPPWEG